MSEEVRELKGIKVCLVDDSATITTAGTVILSKEGAEVITAADGFAAMNMLVKHKPDIIFLDIQMPKLNGYECCSLIKNSDEYNHIPVVILSGNDGMFDKAKARIAGCDDHLPKPINREEIIESIKTILKKKSLAA